MRKWKIPGIALAAAVVLAGVTAAVAAPRHRGLEELGQRAYWSLLTEGQREQAKAIAAEYLAETAPDRLAAGARLLRLAADAATVLTVEQRKEAGRLGWISRHLPDDKRRENLSNLLDGTDREALARRVERLEAATPEERVTIGLEILDQVWDAAEPKVAALLGLTDDQRARIRALATQAREELRPVAVRLSQEKSKAVEKGLALLDASQRQRLDAVRTDLLTRVLDFVRGRR